MSDLAASPMSIFVRDRSIHLPRPIPENIVRKRTDQEFGNAMLRMFRREASGHMMEEALSDENTYRLYQRFNRASTPRDYYLFGAEVALIAQQREAIRDLVRKDYHGPVTMIELGPGSPHAIARKTEPLVRAIEPDVYFTVDKSAYAAHGGAVRIAKSVPGTRTGWRVNDFNRENFEKAAEELQHQKTNILQFFNLSRIYNHQNPEWQGRRVMVQFGSTLGNIEGFPEDGLPDAQVERILKNWRARLNSGDVLVVGLDHNQDEGSLHAAYNLKSIKNFSQAMLRRTKGFREQDFEDHREWHPDAHLYTNGYRAIRDGENKVKGCNVSYLQYEPFRMFNSFKFPVNYIPEKAGKAGFKTEWIVPDQQGRMHLHAYRAN